MSWCVVGSLTKLREELHDGLHGAGYTVGHRSGEYTSSRVFLAVESSLPSVEKQVSEGKVVSLAFLLSP